MTEETEQQKAAREALTAARSARLDALTKSHRKVGAIEWETDWIVFRLPSRDQTREYFRKREEPAEKPDALDYLAQATIVALNEIEDPTAARIAFTSTFLVDFPAFTRSLRVINCLHALAGLVTDEEAVDLGKGVEIRSSRRRSPPA